MSRTILVATLAVLFAVLFGISFALNKQTEPPPRPEETHTPAQLEEGKRKHIAMMKDEQKAKSTAMAAQMKAAAARDKAMREAALKSGRKPKTGGIDISSKWYNETSDGAAGIDQAQREKEADDRDKANAAVMTPKPAPGGAPQPIERPKAIAE